MQFGVSSLTTLTSGANNNAFGASAGQALTTGGSNAFFGGVLGTLKLQQVPVHSSVIMLGIIIMGLVIRLLGIVL